MPDPDQTTTQPLPTNSPATTTAVTTTPGSAVETKTVKPGYKTTEFWLSTAVTVISMLYASGAIGTGTGIDKVIGLIAGVLAAMGYTVSRGAAKK